MQKRTKKRNKLTQNAELAELAYVLHLGAAKLRRTLMEINIPAAYREKLSRRIFDWVNQAQLLGLELTVPNEDAFMTMESTETKCEKLGVF
jgi:hypothetical protein